MYLLNCTVNYLFSIHDFFQIVVIKNKHVELVYWHAWCLCLRDTVYEKQSFIFSFNLPSKHSIDIREDIVVYSFVSSSKSK